MRGLIAITRATAAPPLESGNSVISAPDPQPLDHMRVGEGDVGRDQERRADDPAVQHHRLVVERAQRLPRLRCRQKARGQRQRRRQPQHEPRSRSQARARAAGLTPDTHESSPTPRRSPDRRLRGSR